ncbi:hypothetical protein BaRGS_00014409 [Batillaria attramentaria]|uniref:Uncharacterized protein n=1 Tax=Batillaria attramentaria TaxID=370345 RepID=A0ABD0L475_9CAEN
MRASLIGSESAEVDYAWWVSRVTPLACQTIGTLAFTWEWDLEMNPDDAHAVLHWKFGYAESDVKLTIPRSADILVGPTQSLSCCRS